MSFIPFMSMRSFGRHPATQISRLAMRCVCTGALVSAGFAAVVAPAMAASVTFAPASAAPNVGLDGPLNVSKPVAPVVTHPGIALSVTRCRRPRATIAMRTLTCAPRVSVGLVSLGSSRALVARARTATVATSHFYYADVFAEGSNWSIQGQFYVTNRGSQWWINKVNGTPHCNVGNARVTWCGYVNNGTSSFQVGFNDSHGYARFEPAVWMYSARGCWGSPNPSCFVD
jgi:hypothetical protein